MYEKTIAALIARNEQIDMKIPSLEESIKTYTKMAENFQKELENKRNEKHQNELVIEMLKED